MQLLRWRQHVVRMRPSHENTIEHSGAHPRYAALQMAALRSFAPRSHARNHGTIAAGIVCGSFSARHAL